MALRNSMHYFVTGGAGFIGSNLVDRLLENGHKVTAYDNFSTGKHHHLIKAKDFSSFKIIEGDILDTDKLDNATKECDFIFHFAANADVRFGLEKPRRDLEQNIIGTYNVLEAMRKNKIKEIAFSSTGSVYGEAQVIPTPEDCPFPIQTSLYASSKVSGEGYISSYCEGFDMKGYIFRFVSFLGERYSHGHVFDFYRKLSNDPNNLEVLGNGKQKKSYLYVEDGIDAMLKAIEKSTNKVNIFNLGTDEFCEVNTSISYICSNLGLSPNLHYTGGERGWIGDNPFILLDCERIRALDWKPRFTIKEGIIKTLEYLKDNHQIYGDHFQ